MNTLASMGISAAAVAHLTPKALADVTDDATDEVPRVAALVGPDGATVSEGEAPPEREAEYYTIPRDEWAHTEGIFNAAQRLGDRLARRTRSPESIGVVVEMANSGHHRKRTIVVEHITTKRGAVEVSNPDVGFEELKGMLPDTAEGTVGTGRYKTSVGGFEVVPREVTIEEPCCEDIDLQSSYYYDSSYRPVPGGVMMNMSNGGLCTFGTPAWDFDRGEYIHTGAAHCVNDELNVALRQPSGTIVGYSDKSRYEGTSWWGSRFDAFTVRMTGAGVSGRLGQDHGGYTVPIDGIRTTDYLRDNPNMEVRKRGITTGFEVGTLSNLSAGNDYFTTTAGRDSGDSGGPHYDFDGSNQYIVGIHRGSTSFGNARGTLIQSIENEFNIYVPGVWPH